MPEGPDGKTIIIIKKVSGHGGHHGGAWKVAYADFVTAMMALFMVLWLVNSASVITRERIASYFREPGVFEKGSGTPLEEGGAGILRDAFSPPAEGNVRVTTSQKIYTVDSRRGESPDAYGIGTGENEGEVEDEPRPTDPDAETLDHNPKAGRAKEGKEVKDIKDIKALIDRIKNDQKIDVKIDQRGLHIEIMDTDKASMFEVGSARINPSAEDALMKIAKILSTLPNPIDIEGHTDGKPFNSGTRDRYDNWNLSADRANAARRILIGAGIKEKQIARVVGYADQRLKVPKDPMANANRRISISMRFTELARKALDGTPTEMTEPRPVAPIDGKAPGESPVVPPKPPSEAPKETRTPAQQFRPVDPTEERDPFAEATGEKPVQTSDETTRVTEKGLAVSVGTTKPEGEPIAETEPERPSTWMEKDKIFGNRNPFFGR